MFVVFPHKRADVERARSELCARGSRMPPTKANRGSFAAKTCVIGHEKVCWVLLPSGFPKSGADGFSRLVWPQEDSGSCVLHLTPPPSLDWPSSCCLRTMALPHLRIQTMDRGTTRRASRPIASHWVPEGRLKRVMVSFPSA